MEGGMDIEITYPSKAVIDRTISISFLVENNGWEDKQDVVLLYRRNSKNLGLNGGHSLKMNMEIEQEQEHQHR